MGDLEQLDACQLAHLLRTSELSPFELTTQKIAKHKLTNYVNYGDGRSWDFIS